MLEEDLILNDAAIAFILFYFIAGIWVGQTITLWREGLFNREVRMTHRKQIKDKKNKEILGI